MDIYETLLRIFAVVFFTKKEKLRVFHGLKNDIDVTDFI